MKFQILAAWNLKLLCSLFVFYFGKYRLLLHEANRVCIEMTGVQKEENVVGVVL